MDGAGPTGHSDAVQPTDEALSALGLDDRLQVLSVPSGYPSPKYINLVLRRLDGRSYLFESSAARPDIVSAADDLRGRSGEQQVEDASDEGQRGACEGDDIPSAPGAPFGVARCRVR